MRIRTTHQLVGSDQDVERRALAKRHVFPTPDFAQSLSVFGSTPVWQSLEAGDETGELLLPIVQCRRWGNDEEGTPEVVHFGQIGEQGDPFGLSQESRSLTPGIHPRGDLAKQSELDDGESRNGLPEG